ncbi:MAG: GNAT family N-acetyltransferase [Bacteroidetes bacterium]|nr:GNAT family N-acetyltransferase [Bacteroidota bacterium]
MTWTCKKFDELTPYELYAILQLRNDIFVVEQNCIFQDADNKDQYCFHLMGWEEKKLVAYTRIVPAGISYAESSIGRVVVSRQARKNGTGKLLMQKSIETLFNLFGKVEIKIGAQLYLKKFYESLGFQQTGDIYLEDGIEHIEMKFTPR